MLLYKALLIALLFYCGHGGSTSCSDSPACRIIRLLSLHPSVHHQLYGSLAQQLAAHQAQWPAGQLPAMALVTLQRSPTPSAASTASTTTTTAGEVSLGPGWTKTMLRRSDVLIERLRMWEMLPEKGPLIEAKLAPLVNVLCLARSLAG